MALDSCQNFISAKLLRLDKILQILDIDKPKVVIVRHQLLQIYNRVMVFKSLGYMLEFCFSSLLQE